MRFNVSGRLLLYLAVAPLVATICGCSPAVGSVSGIVTVGGQPVTSGQVSFVAPTGMVFTANIDVDGTYKLGGLPPGEMIVLVFGPPPPVKLPAGGGAAAKKFAAARSAPAAPASGPAVPAKYGDTGTSDLRYTVTAGANTYDPPLK